jgi:hypothetical protein
MAVIAIAQSVVEPANLSLNAKEIPMGKGNNARRKEVKKPKKNKDAKK